MPRAVTPDSRTRLFAAAANLFSTRGFDGVGIDDIAAAAGLNKAMLYYHFHDKLDLYRTVVRDMLTVVGDTAIRIAQQPLPADQRLDAFVRLFADQAAERPWFPPLMLREIAEGAPHLDLDTLTLMRGVFGAFGRILTDGQHEGRFRTVSPVLAYMSIIAPILLNSARERVGTAPDRANFPMFVHIPPQEVVDHMQQAALRLLARAPIQP